MEQIKQLLDKYFEGETSDSEEQALWDYFASNNVAEELCQYRSIFGFLAKAKDNPELIQISDVSEIEPHKQRYLWLVVSGVAASILLAVLLFNQNQGKEDLHCSGTYVMVDGVCYDDLHLVGKYATQAIDQAISPIGSSTVDALDFLDDPYFKDNKPQNQ